MKGKIACIGTGIIGRSWALAFARAGYAVALHDQDMEAALDAAKYVQEQLGDVNPEAVRPAVNLSSALEGAFYVQESIAEDADLKRSLFKQMEGPAGPDTLFGSSSSALPGSRFLGDLEISPRALVVHPTNPPHLVPLTEICPTSWTAGATVEKVTKLMLCIGQTPILIQREVNGFVLNRLQAAVLKEALSLVEGDVATPSDIDLAVSHGLGRRWAFMGPFETGHLNAASGIREYLTKYRDTYQSMMDDLAIDFRIGDAVVGRVADALEAGIPVSDISARQVWRDEALALLRARMNDLKSNNRETAK